jgi:hypothetical protein
MFTKETAIVIPLSFFGMGRDQLRLMPRAATLAGKVKDPMQMWRLADEEAS